MLDLSHEQSLNHVSWESLDEKPRLPEQMKDFFEQIGPMPVHPTCRRSYQRFYLRGKAVLRAKEKIVGVYTADASRQGIRFICPVQLLPKERCRIRLPNTKEFQIEIVRCRRIDECCYECGAMFVLGTS
jgi:PilZ domain